MPEYHARGLTGDWLNAWLAALGVTVLVPDVRLRWSEDELPYAVFDGDLCDASFGATVHRSMLSSDDVAALAIARHLTDSSLSFDRTVTPAAYRERATIARATGDWSLSSSVTDLAREPGPSGVDIEHSPFDPPAPQGKTLWDRVVACQTEVDRMGEVGTARSLERRGTRLAGNGLGFDYRRLVSPSDPVGDVWVDPCIETLAFVGLSFLPIRGDARYRRLRGWDARARGRRLTWPIWREPLTAAAIDGLLDVFWASGPERWPALHLRQAYGSIAYKARAQMDQTRGFASERIL